MVQFTSPYIHLKRTPPCQVLFNTLILQRLTMKTNFETAQVINKTIYALISLILWNHGNHQKWSHLDEG